MEDAAPEAKQFAAFERRNEFIDLQNAILSKDLTVEPEYDERGSEWIKVEGLAAILSEYQEQAYLLDPHLEALVTPVMGRLREHAYLRHTQHVQSSTFRLRALAVVIYNYVKFRGHKTIARFFPHEVADLTIAVTFMNSTDDVTNGLSQWSLRYALLLWISLIIRIPFDLSQFDEDDAKESIAEVIESLARRQLSRAGLERESAAELLARLYMRKDAAARLPGFIAWSCESIKEQSDVFAAIGILQVLCLYVKSSSSDDAARIMTALLAIAKEVKHGGVLYSNTLVRKFRTKLLYRMALHLVPPSVSSSRRQRRTLVGSFVGGQDFADSEDEDVSEEVEVVLEQLFEALQDKDTVVRWSAAKGVARLAERLPPSFSNQILESVLGLFEIHSMAAASLYDMPAIAEATWHGATLACAEMARRELVPQDHLSQLMSWLYKALFFDIRKGAHSVGSNVRDAAAYAIWSLARAQNTSDLAPYADKLAQNLVVVASYDREVHIRRAASAAFQEHVGRMSLFPHGIDVLRKTDFYAVSVRRNAFVIVAPQVSEHPEYRNALLDHIMNVSIRHWDASIRESAAQSLCGICQLNLLELGPQCINRLNSLFESVDNSDVHGALLGLTDLAKAFNEATDAKSLQCRGKIFASLELVPPAILNSPRNELVMVAACHLIATSISHEELAGKATSPHWRKVIDLSLRHRSSVVQEAAAEAMKALSRLEDCSTQIQQLIAEFIKGAPHIQQSLCRVLGVFDYRTYPQSLRSVIDCLLQSIDSKSSTRLQNVEARRLAHRSIPQIVENVLPRVSELITPQDMCDIIESLDNSLDDYTTDERGDVGSWIRMASIEGLTSISLNLLSQRQAIDAAGYLPIEKFHHFIGRILRQGVERLDNVRQVVGDCLLRLLAFSTAHISGVEQWRLKGEDLMRKLFSSDDERVGWANSDWLFPRVVELLGVQQYRKQLLLGLISSVGTKTSSIQRPASASLVTYAQNLPLSRTEIAYSLSELSVDLLGLAQCNLSSNTVVLPVLQTYNVLLEADALGRLATLPEGLQNLKSLLSLVSRGVQRLKNVQRIYESMKITINLLGVPEITDDSIPRLVEYLGHLFPRVRAAAAEHLYMVLQTKDFDWQTDEIEELLLETEWPNIDLDEAKAKASDIVKIMKTGS
ncbi:ARM repeat-containing protein [Coniophora puteana RWD-64-598 SS2]|uniref:ARM repeat-containing protein n=1 Tax=Coniophora puteana (strain RWD-64-598) TaxID=741705 RepID=A0A5M3MPK5_CONPW|nr:ARM repeat-containing protein [Coniophora puteana RWD-64-598 SS2]EIW80977.1 ARM repeat-containing protein [Coniophora puteana RWD-64-598 SS2]